MENMPKFTEYRLAWECADEEDVIIEWNGYFIILNVNDMTRLVNSNDIDVRIKVKEAAKEAGYMIVPVNGKDMVLPTIKLIQKLRDIYQFEVIEALEQRG